MLCSVSTVSLVAPSAGAAAPHGSDYVSAVFAEFLGRAPSASELQQATATSMTTQAGRVRLVRNVVTSQEYASVLARGLYARILGRAADAGGLAHWAARLATPTVTYENAEAEFFASAEFVGAASLDAWVDRVYRVVFGRSVDAGGAAYWSDVARRTSLQTVARALVGSDEANRADTTDAYRRILHREPDAGGLDYWADQMMRRGQVYVEMQLAAGAEAYGPLRAGEVVKAPPAEPLPAQLAHNKLTTRLVTVRAAAKSSTTAELIAWERTVVGWHVVLGPYTAHSGKRGWSKAAARHESDGTSPSGRFGFRGGFGLAPNPGYQLGWFVVDARDYWTSDPSRSDYNTHQRGPTNPAAAPWSSAEHLIDYPVAYRYAAVIDFNMPPTGPRGSAVFLHVSTGGPTAGCVSLPESQLLAVLRWIDAGTRIVMGPTAWIRSL